jgi:hypothetical protein
MVLGITEGASNGSKGFETGLGVPFLKNPRKLIDGPLY